MTGRWFREIVESFQLQWTSNVASQGYPRIILSSPRLVTKKHMGSFFSPVVTSRVVNSLSSPALLGVPSMFHIFRAASKGIVPIPNCFSSQGSRKLSVAPESTRTSWTAIFCAVSKCMGTFKDLYWLYCTLEMPKALAQAAGFEPTKNPSSQRLSLWSSHTLTLGQDVLPDFFGPFFICLWRFRGCSCCRCLCWVVWAVTWYMPLFLASEASSLTLEFGFLHIR